MTDEEYMRRLDAAPACRACDGRGEVWTGEREECGQHVMADCRACHGTGARHDMEMSAHVWGVAA